MTDNEIVKALECCRNSDYNKIQYALCAKCAYSKTEECKLTLQQDTLDLINSQKADNERLKKESNEWSRRFINRCRDYEFEIQENEKLKAEVERLKIELTAMRNSASMFKSLYEELKAEHLETVRLIKTAETEAVKRFVEKFVALDDIEKITNEMVGGE